MSGHYRLARGQRIDAHAAPVSVAEMAVRLDREIELAVDDEDLADAIAVRDRFLARHPELPQSIDRRADVGHFCDNPIHCSTCLNIQAATATGRRTARRKARR